MSNEFLDDPMEIGAQVSGPADESHDSLNGGAEDPAPPTFGLEREAVGPLNVPKMEVPNFQEVMQNPALSAHLTRLDEKKDRETFDEIYDLTVTEPAVDVESLMCCYEGNAFFIRARFIAKHCPPLRADAYIALINYLREQTKDITHYMIFFNELEIELAKKDLTNKVLYFQIPTRDSKWIEETGSSWQIALNQYQSEYKRHKDEGVKESTRRAMEDLFQHFVNAGKVEDAIRLYSRGIRDYCTQLKHSINMWLNWIEVSICANDWGRLESVTSTAFRSLKDADDAEKNNQQQRGENAPYLVERDQNVSITALSNRLLIETALAKCLTAQTILKLIEKKYSDVVDIILQIKTECLQSKWFVTSSDLGIYAMLCAMATKARRELKRLVGGNGTFRKLLESEPLFIDLLTAYTSSRFGRCFDIMNSVRNRLLLDPFISRNVDELFSKIRQKCVIQYLQPYSTVKLETMCKALGTTRIELQKSLIELIENKNVLIKIDQSAGVIRVVNDKDEDAILRRVDETCNRAVLKAKYLLWKSALSSANIFSVTDKETRPKRKNQKDTSRQERSAIDVDEDVVSGRAAPSAAVSDDFNISYEPQQFLDELGDI